MIKVTHVLNNNSKSTIEADGYFEFDIPSCYDVRAKENEQLVSANICFHKEREGISKTNGVSILDIMTIVEHRLRNVSGPGASLQEQKALEHIQEAMLWLNYEDIRKGE